jgi:hypothetical protein
MKKYVAVVVGMLTVAFANAAVVLSNNSVTLIRSGNNYQISPNGGSTIFFSKTYNPSTGEHTFRATDTTADASVDIFVVNYGDVLSQSTLSPGSYPVFTRVPRSGITGAFGEFSSTIDPELYLGFNFDERFDPSVPGSGVFLNRRNFGWGLFDLTSTNDLRLVSSAVVSGANGIVVGTNEAISAVPLPAAAWLMLSGVGLLGAAARHRKPA